MFSHAGFDVIDVAVIEFDEAVDVVIVEIVVGEIVVGDVVVGDVVVSDVGDGSVCPVKFVTLLLSVLYPASSLSAESSI